VATSSLAFRPRMVLSSAELRHLISTVQDWYAGAVSDYYITPCRRRDPRTFLCRWYEQGDLDSSGRARFRLREDGLSDFSQLDRLGRAKDHWLFEPGE
jgi:hypothetical protein